MRLFLSPFPALFPKPTVLVYSAVVLSNFHSLIMPCDSQLFIRTLLCLEFPTPFFSSHYEHLQVQKANQTPPLLLSHSTGRTVHFLCVPYCSTHIIHSFPKYLLNNINYVPDTVLVAIKLREDLHVSMTMHTD